MVQTLVLASGSPRRVRLLRSLGIRFSTMSPDVEETHDGPPSGCAPENARKKALSAPGGNGRYVLGADTVISLDGTCMGKPASREDATSMLLRLSGRSHEVITGWAIADNRGIVAGGTESTVVTFRDIRGEIPQYIDTGEWRGKAGGYAIQGKGRAFVSSINGSYSNVMGLPLEAVAKALADLGFAVGENIGPGRI